MDMDMSIAAMSVDLAASRTGQALGVAVLREAMDASETAAELLSSMPESLDPDLGTLVDILA